MTCPYCYHTAHVYKTKPGDGHLGKGSVIIVKWRCDRKRKHIWHEFLSVGEVQA